MMRSYATLPTILWLLVVGATWAADPAPAGNYKLVLNIRGQQAALWLLKLETKDGKVTGSVVTERAGGVPPAKMADLTLRNNILRFTLDLKTQQGTVKVGFEGK